MSELRPIIVVHTRGTEKPDEWPLWGLTDESLVALFHVGGCISGCMLNAEAIKKVCDEARIVPDVIDVCVACGHAPDEVYRAMQAMINCSTSRPIYVAIHDGIGGKEATKRRDEVELRFPAGGRCMAVYSIGDAEEHRQIIHDYTASARSGLPEYADALARLTKFLLEDLH